MPGPEFNLVEKPAIDFLVGLGYTFLDRQGNELGRDGLNQVLLRDEVLAAVQRLNGVGPDVAEAVYHELLSVSDNQEWVSILRGNYSRTVPGQSTKQTIRLVDFQNPGNNSFVVTTQLRVESEHPRVADLVIYLNGVPVVVIEAKAPSKGLRTAYEQIRQYEQQIPRLFYANAFNIVTNAHEISYGSTAADWAWWGKWRDPWPKTSADFGNDLQAGLWALLEPSRLLDLLAHFIVFETDPDSGRVVKKVCRYQQYRAVRKIADRVNDPDQHRGLIWHTQGSGKSLTMVFAALRAKTHLTEAAPGIASPSLMVVTDRKDLDRQISNTFEACGLPNPKPMRSKDELRKTIHSGVAGLTILSTIHKFEDSRKPVANSADWIVLVDEAHRTQEKDLGAFLRATFPDAQLFGFTGTPVRKGDLDTFENFSPPGEGYLDRYSIDDAVADGATVPIRYTSRKTEWHIDPGEIDLLFDNWFANESEERIAAIKKRGVTLAELAKHLERVHWIAKDIWTHFRGHAQPDGYKAQIVAIDREAVILYKRALDRVIARSLIKKGMTEDEAHARAASTSAPVYSSAQDDEKPSDDTWTNGVRQDLRRYALDEQAEKEVIARFQKADAEPSFLIVCNKLLTGFDAPRESVMYLDSPLTDHNLLQAIARTNRVCGPKKKFGVIVDYIGVTRKLDEALQAYRKEDIENAMRDLDEERDALRAAHRAVFNFLGNPSRKADDKKRVYDALADGLQDEDQWYTFRRLAEAFISIYESLSPDPAVLDFQWDLKWIVEFIGYATPIIDKDPPPDLSDLSPKIRELLQEHLNATGLTTIVKARTIIGDPFEQPEFWKDFEAGKSPEELKHATIRKAVELKKVTYDKAQDSPAQYGKFSERVLEIIRRFEQDQIDAAEALKALEDVARDVQAEGNAYLHTGLSQKAYGLLKILEIFVSEGSPTGPAAVKEASPGREGPPTGDPAHWLANLTDRIARLYGDSTSAPAGWHRKEQLRKELRQRVRLEAHQAGFPTEVLKELPNRVEEYALRHYVRIG